MRKEVACAQPCLTSFVSTEFSDEKGDRLVEITQATFPKVLPGYEKGECLMQISVNNTVSFASRSTF